MKVTQHVWGERFSLREDSTHSTCYLKLLEKKRCSWHRQRQKYNLFLVISGKVGIKTDDCEIILTPGMTATILPGVWHEFRVYEPSEMIEEMYVSYDESDIERKHKGGSF